MSETSLADGKAEGIARQLKEVAYPISKEGCAEEASQLKGKVVVITGSGSGFGKAYALRAASYGAKIVLSDLSLEAVQAVEKEIKAAGGEATSIKCNTTVYEDQVAMFKHAVDTFGVVDIVFPNAGVPEMKPLIEVTTESVPEKPDLLPIEVNIIGVMYTVRLAFHYLQINPAKSGKALIWLGSMSSFFGIPAAPQYSTSKHAVLGMFRACYYEGKGLGIRTGIVCPWFVHTPILNTPARLIIAGLPLATVDGVVDAMLYASSNDKADGDALAVDPDGVLGVPFDTFLGVSVDDNFYYAFVKRGEGAIKLKYTIRDSILALKRGAGWKLLPILALLAYAPKLFHMVLGKFVGEGQVGSAVAYGLAIAVIFFWRG